MKNELLTMTQAVKFLGMGGYDPSRKLRKLLREIGEKRKITTLIERNKRFFTTKVMLQKVLPELFEEPEANRLDLAHFLAELQSLVSKYQRSIKGV